MGELRDYLVARAGDAKTTSEMLVVVRDAGEVFRVSASPMALGILAGIAAITSDEAVRKEAERYALGR